MSLKIIRQFILVLIIIVISGNIGYRMGVNGNNRSTSNAQVRIPNQASAGNRDIDLSLFWTVWGKLEQNYIDKTKINQQNMVNGAISGMVASLGDPYTVFLPPKENEEYKQDLNGTFEGIGAQLGSKDDRIIVVAPLKDHPAEKAGIRAGDWIVKVNNESTSGWTVPQAVTKIRGPRGSKVNLTIIHEGSDNTVDIVVVRDKINVKSVEWEEKTSLDSKCKTQTCPKVAYIKLTRFGDTTNDEWTKAITEIKPKIIADKLSGVLLDLRNNPGGYFQSSIYVASEFLKSGTVVIQENSDGTRETFSVDRVGNLLDVPLIVLINKGSASAAEIVAGALKDQGRAKLIGETTFGKGSVQTPEDLPGGAGLHITTARWIMPKGDWINGKGIVPDIEVKTPSATSSSDLDPQLERGIELLTK